jgi:hypothetical protein
VWGSNQNPWGNWAAYVAGANTDASGLTYVKLGWNPIYLEPTTPFRDVPPTFGAEIVCNGDDCVGLPCKIDPAVSAVNEVTGAGTDGAGGAAFCVVTVPAGSSADIVVFDGSGGNGGDNGGDNGDDTPTTTEVPPEPTPTYTPEPEPTTTSEPEPTTTYEPEPTTTSEEPTTTTAATTTSTWSAPSSSITPSSSYSYSYSVSPSYSYSAHVFMENSAISNPTGAAATSQPAAPTQTGASTTTVVSTMSLALSFLLVTFAVQF